MQAEAPLLVANSLVKQFGGIRAVNDVSFEVRQGEILGLIGPNGAGKTTTFNLISSRFPLTAGEVLFDGKRISGMRADKVAKLGVARTFQGARIFPGLTALENIETAQFSQQTVGFWEDWIGLRHAKDVRDRAIARSREILEFLEMARLADTAAGSLAYAHQSLLGIGMALALEPRLLMLDEPFAGMNPQETMQSAAKVSQIRDSGITVLLVEHDMAAVMGLCDRIVVLDQGAKIAEGNADEIRSNPRVIEAYLGTEEDA